MAESKKSARQWMKDPEVQAYKGKTVVIRDPDGWRHNDGVTLDTPITRDDFWRRFNQSTIEIK